VGSAARISIRGVGGKGLKIFLDGAPLTAVEGIFALDNLPVQLIDRIEIYKGIAPAYLGADALGGAINVVIIDRDVDFLEASYSAGSYNTQQGVIRVRKHWTDKGIRFGGGLVPVYAKNNYEMDLSFLGPAFEGMTVTRDHDAWKWLGYGVGLTFTKLWFDEIEVELEGLVQQKENQGISQPTFHTTTSTVLPVIAMSANKDDFFMKGLDFDWHAGYVPHSITWHVDTTHVSRHWDGSSEQVSFRGELDQWVPHKSRDILRGTQQRLNLSYHANDGLTFNLNDVFQYIETRPDDPLADQELGVTSSDYPANMITNSLGLACDATFLEGRFLNQVIGKMHYIKSEVYGKGIYQVDLITGIPLEGKNNEYHYGFSEAIRYRILPSLSMKASYERAVRLPNQAELFGNGANIGPGLSLKPEKAHHVNLGIHFLKENMGDIPRFEAELNGFYYDTEDKIKLEPSFLISVFKNLQHTRTLGVEAEIKTDIRKWLYLTANATYQDIRDVEGYLGVLTKDARIPNVPWLFMNFAAEFTKYDLFRKGNKGKLFWEGGYIHEFYSTWKVNDTAKDIIESTFAMNLGVEYAFKDKLTLSLEVNDITNVALADEYEMPLPGRTIRANMHLFLQSFPK
jgi:outer membrane receptor protein involved in Fe transport